MCKNRSPTARVRFVWKGSVSVRAVPSFSTTLRNTDGVLSCVCMRVYACVCVCMRVCDLFLSTIERADATNSDSQRTILADAAHGPPSRTCTAVPSWADSALRCIKLQEKALRAHVQLSVFLLHVMTRGLRGESENPLQNARCCLRGPFEKPAQLAVGQVKPEAPAWCLSDGSQTWRLYEQLDRESG